MPRVRNKANRHTATTRGTGRSKLPTGGAPLIEDRLMSAKEVREPHDGLRMAARRSVFHQEGPVQPTCPAPGGPSGGQDAPRGLFMHPRMQTSVNAPTPIESRYAFRAHSEEVCLRRSQL